MEPSTLMVIVRSSSAAPLQHCSLNILIFPAQSASQSAQWWETETNLSSSLLISPPSPCWWQWSSSWSQQSSSVLTLPSQQQPVQSGSNSVCPGLSYCHTFSTLTCNTRSESTQYNTIVYQLSVMRSKGPSPSLSSTQSNGLAGPGTQFGWETHNLGNKVRTRKIWQVGTE